MNFLNLKFGSSNYIVHVSTFSECRFAISEDDSRCIMFNEAERQDL